MRTDKERGERETTGRKLEREEAKESLVKR